jgi:hypothetical protein
VSPLFQSYPSFRLNWLFVISDRLLFATTNHIERLDPALSRPGRMDVWINFTNATKWQAEGIFKCFFPSRPSASSSSPPSSDEASSSADASDKHLPDSRRKASSAHAVPILEEAEIAQLAKRFADAIPEGEMSVRHNIPPAVTHISFLTHSVCRLLAYKGTCSRTRPDPENPWRKLPNGARQSSWFGYFDGN